MSRARSRPTREETSERVFAAALKVFQRVGIAGASIEEIVKEAGLSRGAFYSSWANKDELVVAILQRHVAEAIQRNQTLAARFPEPVEFLHALMNDDDGVPDEAGSDVAGSDHAGSDRAGSGSDGAGSDRSGSDHEMAIRGDSARPPMLDRFPLLHLELTLYVARSPEHRPTLSALLQAVRKTTGALVLETMRNAGVTRHIDPEEAGAMLLALEDGFDLHRLIDPEQTTKDAYFRTLQQLQSLVLDSRQHQDNDRGGLQGKAVGEQSENHP